MKEIKIYSIISKWLRKGYPGSIFRFDIGDRRISRYQSGGGYPDFILLTPKVLSEHNIRNWATTAKVSHALYLEIKTDRYKVFTKREAKIQSNVADHVVDQAIMLTRLIHKGYAADFMFGESSEETVHLTKQRIVEYLDGTFMLSTTIDEVARQAEVTPRVSKDLREHPVLVALRERSLIND